MGPRTGKTGQWSCAVTAECAIPYSHHSWKGRNAWRIWWTMSAWHSSAPKQKEQASSSTTS
eukprot:2602912-Amphidinium_carterae.1